MAIVSGQEKKAAEIQAKLSLKLFLEEGGCKHCGNKDKDEFVIEANTFKEFCKPILSKFEVMLQINGHYPTQGTNLGQGNINENHFSFQYMDTET